LTETELKIEVLTARRHAIWSGAPEKVVGEAVNIGKQLADLYEQRRHERVRAESGRTRTEIVRRARVESELERLMKR
jgi:hypothetical protein